MNDELEIILASILMGGALGALVYGCDEWFAAKFQALERDMADKLRRLRTSTRYLRPLLIAWVIAIGCALLGFWFVWNSITFALLVSALLAAGPWYVLRRMAERRRLKIEDQLASAMVSLASAVKAGLALPQALELLADECPRPINAEFYQLVAEYKMGKPLDRTLIEAKERLRSENFTVFAAAMLASHESGGKLNETVERIARSVLEQQRVQRKVISETAQARKSAVYMALVPAFILVVYYFVDPVNTTMLFTTPVGQVLLGIAVALNIAAYLWARAILNPDI
jgi:tight adherence protein B